MSFLDAPYYLSLILIIGPFTDLSSLIIIHHFLIQKLQAQANKDAVKSSSSHPSVKEAFNYRNERFKQRTKKIRPRQVQI